MALGTMTRAVQDLVREDPELANYASDDWMSSDDPSDFGPWVERLVRRARETDKSSLLASRVALATVVILNREALKGFLRALGVPSYLVEGLPERPLDPGLDPWLEAGRQASSDCSDFDVALRLVEAAIGWSRDHDRSHLLALPAEERALLTQLIEHSM